VSLGWAFVDNLVVHATVAGTSATEPGLDCGSASPTARDTIVFHWLFGAGATWYALPADVYVSAVLGVSALSIEIDSMEYDGNLGAAFRVEAGKDFAVSEALSFGVALFVALGSNTYDDTDELVWTYTLGLMATAVYD